MSLKFSLSDDTKEFLASLLLCLFGLLFGVFIKNPENKDFMTMRHMYINVMLFFVIFCGIPTIIGVVIDLIRFKRKNMEDLRNGGGDKQVN